MTDFVRCPASAFNRLGGISIRPPSALDELIDPSLRLSILFRLLPSLSFICLRSMPVAFVLIKFCQRIFCPTLTKKSRINHATFYIFFSSCNRSSDIGSSSFLTRLGWHKFRCNKYSCILIFFLDSFKYNDAKCQIYQSSPLTAIPKNRQFHPVTMLRGWKFGSRQNFWNISSSLSNKISN